MYTLGKMKNYEDRFFNIYSPKDIPTFFHDVSLSAGRKGLLNHVDRIKREAADMVLAYTYIYLGKIKYVYILGGKIH